MQYMSLNGDGDPRYGRIVGKADNQYQNKQRMGAIESFVTDNTQAGPQKPSDYKMYERNNIIASSKFATPKQIEMIASEKTEENDVYVQCAKPQVANASSPTNSLSGVPQQSGTSRTGASRSHVSPVYENIDYYGSHSNAYPPFYHHPTLNHQESLYRKAQPQVPTGNRHQTVRDMEAPPVYENVQEYSNRSVGATPGPQVVSGQAPPPYPNQSFLSNNPSIYNSNQPVYSVMHSPRPILNNLKASPQTPFYQKPLTKSLTQEQIDEINGSDYVCMTGNVSQTLSTNIPFQTTSAKNYERTPATGIAGAPTKPPKEKPKSPEQENPHPQPVPSPTPSSCSSSSGKLKISGKNLLPYCVTPPRPQGPTEAQRKIEEMTRQIEEEMEKHEEEGEYFGN